MLMQLRPLGFSGAFLLAGLMASTLLRADDPSQAVESFVSKALVAEAEGDFLSRQQYLASASECDAECELLKWQMGYLRGPDGNWVSIPDCVSLHDQSELLDEYERKRADLADNLANQLAVGQWCQQQGLWQQARAHFERVLDFNSDHVPARIALGYRLFNGEWISPAEQLAFQARAQAATESYREFATKLIKLRSDLASHPKARERAEQKLLAIDDAKAIPAVESLFLGADNEVASIVVRWMQQIDSIESSQALMRYSIFHPTESIRDEALAALSKRPLHDFVPELLAMTSSPIHAMAVPIFNADGSLAGYQQAFAQETNERRNVTVFQTAIQRQNSVLTIDNGPAPGQDPNSSVVVGRLGQSLETWQANMNIERTLRNTAQMETAMREQQIERDNVAIQQRNTAIADIMSQIAGKEFSGEAKEMWKWWDEYNETNTQGSKTQRNRGRFVQHRVPRYVGEMRRVYANNASEGRLPLSVSNSSQDVRTLRGNLMVPNSRQGRFDCFVAGTPVMTTRGPRAIESIVAGDTVITRDVETGALVTKPVLGLHRQPPLPTVVLTIDDEEEIQCSSGHLFWISGKGWVKASEIGVGDILHAAEHPVVVSHVSKAPPRETFNVEVADTHSLFVGKSLVFTHDVTPRTPTRKTVPGLVLAAN